MFCLARLFLAVHDAPDVGDVAKDEWHKDGNDSHGLQGKLAAATVLNGERALQVGVGGVEGRVVESRTEEETQHDEYHTDACWPYPLCVGGMEE